MERLIRFLQLKGQTARLSSSVLKMLEIPADLRRLQEMRIIKTRISRCRRTAADQATTREAKDRLWKRKRSGKGTNRTERDTATP